MKTFGKYFALMLLAQLVSAVAFADEPAKTTGQSVPCHAVPENGTKELRDTTTDAKKAEDTGATGADEAAPPKK